MIGLMFCAGYCHFNQALNIKALSSIHTVTPMHRGLVNGKRKAKTLNVQFIRFLIQQGLEN